MCHENGVSIRSAFSRLPLLPVRLRAGAARRLAKGCADRALAVLAFALIACSASVWAAPKIVVVPASAADPTIPHLAYNGRPVTLKAIARGFSSLAEAQSASFRWDTDGDGAFDDEPVAAGESLRPRQCVEATPEGTTCYDLGKVITLPEQPANRLLRFTVRLAVPGQQDVYGSYPVFVRADVPAQTNPADNRTALPQHATDEQLEVMRAVALDEALWYLHLNIHRSGSAAGITGTTPPTQSLGIMTASTAAALLLLEKTGHFPAYPPGAYAGVSPQGFAAANDARWNNDPYAEDAVRLFNHLLSGLAASGITSADEEDDGMAPIPGTNDVVGLTYPAVNAMWAANSLPLASIAYSGLAGRWPRWAMPIRCAAAASSSSCSKWSITWCMPRMTSRARAMAVGTMSRTRASHSTTRILSAACSSAFPRPGREWAAPAST